MTVLDSEVKFYKSAVVSDAPANGGRLGIVQAVSAVAQAVFADASQAERTAGSTKYRKLFVKVESPTDEELTNTFLFMNRITPGDDAQRFFAATQVDTQNDISSPVRFGVGQLDSTVSAAVTSIDVLVEDWAVGAIFKDTDVIRITDKATLGGAGNEEIVTINAAPSPAGNVITLSFTPALANGYNSSNTHISSGINIGSIVGTFDTWVETSGSGTYDEGTPGNVVVDSIGGIEQDWTLTFTSPTAFDLTGDTLGSVGSGVIGSNFVPNNPDFTAPYFTILSAGWGGTWASSDTVAFTTHPAAEPFWLERTIPAAAAAIAANFVDMIVIGESV